MRVIFEKPGRYKLGARLVESAAGQIHEVHEADVTRYREGVHYRIAADVDETIAPPSDPEPAGEVERPSDPVDPPQSEEQGARGGRRKRGGAGAEE